MKQSLEYTLSIPASGSGISDDGWREASTRHIETWREAQNLLQAFSFSIPGVKVSVGIDWSPVVKSIRRFYRVMDRIEKHMVACPNESWFGKYRFQRSPTVIPCKVVVERKRTEKPDFPSAYIETCLFDVFLMMNIADPGCCEFFRSSMRLDDKRAHKWDRRPTDFSLSAVHFDVAALRSVDGKWPTTEKLPLDLVVRWFKSARLGVAQVPRNRIEKVLFGLWHLCTEDLSQTSVVWIFYCLETLLDTKPNENRKALLERVLLILQPDTKQAGYIARNLNKLYEYRSGLVHGGLQLYHPLQSESLDPAVEARYSDLMQVIDFGFAILLVTVQSIVKRGWSAPKFTSSVTVENDA